MNSREKVLEIVFSNRTETSLETIDVGQERKQNDYVSGLNIRAYGLPTATFIAGWITYLRMKKLLPTSSSTTFQLLFSDVNPRDMGKFFFFYLV